MGLYRSTNPLEWDDVDGIIVNESAPAASVQGVAANTAILVGQFQRGPLTLQEPGSIGALLDMYGKSSASGNLALKNKKFGRLKIIRVAAAAAVKASLTLDASSVDIITFTAKYPGAYGNGIKVAAAAGAVAGTTTYTITDTNTGATLPAEVYANIEASTMTAALFSASKLVDVTIVATSAEPDPVAATALSSGSDGTVADTDYQTAIAKAEAEGAGNVLFLDVYNSTRNGYLKAHAAACPDKMVICSNASETTDRAAAVTDVASYRDTEGRIIYAFNWIKANIDGVETWTNPAHWVASIFSQIAPHIDLASVQTRDFMAGATGVYHNLSRADFVALKEAGIAAFESSDGYIKIKSGVTTQIADSSKVLILRRRMADYLTQSAAKYLENYQNVPNKKSTRAEIAAGITEFVTRHENEGVLPKDSEVSSGFAKLIDAESLNTDASIAAGFVKILWKQRIFSSMRFIVLQAEIGESVVVTAA
jgi:hypothetical protein